MSRIGAAPRAAVTVSNARAEASRRNGANSRGPKSPEGKARSAQNALKHGLRAEKHVVLPDEDAAEFAELEAALIEELAPVGALQAVLARRVAVAAWRLARADRIEADLFEERWRADGGPGIALIRDGNGTRSFETLLRYRGAAMAEFSRALRTLKALQAEARTHAATRIEASRRPQAVGPALAAVPFEQPIAPEKKPNEPKSGGNPAKPGQPRGKGSPGGVPWSSCSGRALLSSPSMPLSTQPCCARSRSNPRSNVPAASRRPCRMRHAAPNRASAQERRAPDPPRPFATGFQSTAPASP